MISLGISLWQWVTTADYETGGGGGAFSPSLDFSDARDSQYLAFV